MPTPKNKIITLQLQSVVEELISSGITTSVGIANALKAKGYPVSQPTVSRYLQVLKEERKEQTKQILDDHLKVTLPADLTALESMEKQCLDWAGETNNAFAHRLASQHIEEAYRGWIDRILKLDSDDRKKVIKEIITQCLSWTADDFKVQGAKITAMRQATQIIDMKLRYAMGESTDGKIIFVDRERGDQLMQDEQSGGYMVIPGGKP